jgi:deoxyxylulose-5-phosphate synthase
MMPGVEFFEPGDVQDMFNVLNYSISSNPGIVYVRLPKIKTPRLPVDNSSRRLDYYEVRGSERPDNHFGGEQFCYGEFASGGKQTCGEGISSRVINVVNPKKLDEGFVRLVADDRPLLVAYNGNPAVLQSAVLNRY